MSEAEDGKHALPTQFRVCVLSKDLRLYQTCHEVTVSLGLTNCDVVIADPDPTFPVEGDLLVWDLDDIRWSQSEWHMLPNRGAQEQLFVVRRKNVQDFLDKLPLGAGSTLLKPVTAATLRIFVEQAAVRAKSRADKPHPEGTDRQELLQCLLTTNLKLQEYDQDRTNFLARAVHDFRAPLTAICGYCGLLHERAMGPLNGGQLEIVQRMQHSATKLTRMASTMLELSVGTQLDRRPKLKAAPIRVCIDHAVHEIVPVAANKKIKLTVDVTDPDPLLSLEPEQIEQVLVNLLENACRFTPEGGEIQVLGYPTSWPGRLAISGESPGAHSRGSDSDDEGPSELSAVYRVDVVDTGAGISDEHLEGVFEEYTSYRGSQDRSGGGLGLAICKMILTAHGGRIWAENRPVGARLSFILPWSKAPGRQLIERMAKPRTKARIAAS
jgi:signal transduction histidine kinase